MDSIYLSMDNIGTWLCVVDQWQWVFRSTLNAMKLLTIFLPHVNSSIRSFGSTKFINISFIGTRIRINKFIPIIDKQTGLFRCFMYTRYRAIRFGSSLNQSGNHLEHVQSKCDSRLADCQQNVLLKSLIVKISCRLEWNFFHFTLTVDNSL